MMQNTFMRLDDTPFAPDTFSVPVFSLSTVLFPSAFLFHLHFYPLAILPPSVSLNPSLLLSSSAILFQFTFLFLFLLLLPFLSLSHLRFLSMNVLMYVNHPYPAHSVS